MLTRPTIDVRQMSLVAPALSARLFTGYRDGVFSETEERDTADAAVVESWLSGSDDALRLAYDQFGALVLTYCNRSMRDRTAALDCVQETFISAWKSRDRFDPERGAFGAWLLGIARYRVMDSYRAQNRAPTPIDDSRLHADDAQERPHDDEIADQLLVARALDSLTPRMRQVVELAFYSDLTQSDIAERLDMPIGTVKSDMRRGLQTMRRHLHGRPVAHAHSGPTAPSSSTTDGRTGR